MRMKAIPIAMPWAPKFACKPKKFGRKGSNKSARAGSPIQPSASDDIVMPNWHAARLRSSFSTARARTDALLRPCATSWDTRLRRTATNENSEATKKPFARTSTRTDNTPTMLVKLASSIGTNSSRNRLLRAYAPHRNLPHRASKGTMTDTANDIHCGCSPNRSRSTARARSEGALQLGAPRIHRGPDGGRAHRANQGSRAGAGADEPRRSARPLRQGARGRGSVRLSVVRRIRVRHRSRVRARRRPDRALMRSVILRALADPCPDHIAVARGKLFLAMRHAQFRRRAPVEQPHQIAAVGIAGNDHLAEFGALHEARVRGQVEPALLCSLAAGLMTADAPAAEDRNHVFGEAGLCCRGGCAGFAGGICDFHPDRSGDRQRGRRPQEDLGFIFTGISPYFFAMLARGETITACRMRGKRPGKRHLDRHSSGGFL